MSLILAIEPDRRQVAHLISIVRHVQGAELILADTTERALESIGNNVPDLILVPALLSPQDDAALAAALRVIASAAHVQMLTIPTFATPKARPKKGLLSAFRRSSAEEGPIEGCDPKVFAEEIASYIERANEERAAAQYYDDDQDEPQPGEPMAARESMNARATAAPSAPVVEEQEQELPPLESLVVSTDTGEPYLYRPVEEAPLEAVEPVEPARAGEPPADAEPAYVAAETAYVEDARVEQADAAPEPELEPERVPVPMAAAEPETEIPVIVEPEPEEAPVVPAAAAPPPAEPAFDEPVTTVEHTDALIVDEDLPVAAAPEPVEDLAAAPAFEDLLADFERANLPVIEEVRAEQWMGDAAESMKAEDDGETFEEDEDSLDIDLSVELDAVLHPDEPAQVAEPPALRQFEPVVPHERFEPMPLAAWHAWPRLDWAPPEKPVDLHAVNGDAHQAPEPVQPTAVEFVQAAFEDALEAEETAKLERFEPVMPVERFEPMPLAAWHAWPRMEGVAAEAYQEPIAPRKAAAKPEWVELMRSLREDIARRRAELDASGPVAPPPQKPHRPRLRATAETRPRAAARTPEPPPPPVEEKKRPKRTRPIEDEWGLFDPEQCGFAALLDKLDEITVAPPPRPNRRTER